MRVLDRRAGGGNRRTGGGARPPHWAGHRAAWRTSGKTASASLTTRLASEFGTVVVEDLHVAGMVKNRRLARHVADASFWPTRRQVEYKATGGMAAG